MKEKLTRLELAWILYDVGNSAFILLVATIVPIYFNYLADLAGISSVDYLAYWGYAASAATLIVAVIGPALGAIADTQNYKKPLFAAMVAVGVVGCACLGLGWSWLAFLVLFVVAKVGYSASLIFYDAMLTDITDETRMDRISSHGYAWGYIGSCVPFGVCLVLVLGAEKFGLTMNYAMSIAFCIIAGWWAVMTLPLLRRYRQRHFVQAQGRPRIRDSFIRIWQTLKTMKQDPKVFWFLLAFFFYIDGVYTIIDMATAYGQALGLDTTGLLAALLVTQIVAFPFSILYGHLSRKYRPDRLITLCILAYTGIAIFALFMSTQLHFWILAVCVGMFQGGIQALSRSWFAKIIPPEKSGEYFGFLDICGKGASFLGTTVVSVASQISGNVNIGVGMLAVIFLIGFFLFRKSVAICQREKNCVQ